jgi:pimeloyl-ACP methyl ester carboxylesterase
MTKPVVMASTLVTNDRVPIEAIHMPGNSDLAIVVAHGFTLSWQRPNVWRIANRFNRMAGVLTFDFRGHGRSGGLSTLGDREINDLDVVVRWARELGYQRVAAVGFSMGASIVLRYAGLVGGLDAVVSVSGPGRWYYRGTRSMRWVHRPVRHPPVAEDPDQPGRLEAAAGTSGRGGGADLAGAAADRARGEGPLLPFRARASALHGGRGTQGALAHTGHGPRRVRLRPGTGRPHQSLDQPGHGPGPSPR